MTVDTGYGPVPEDQADGTLMSGLPLALAQAQAPAVANLARVAAQEVRALASQARDPQAHLAVAVNL